MRGVKNCQRKNMKKMANIMPYWSKTFRIALALSGRIDRSIFDPSSGGTGTRLKMANTMFVMTVSARIKTVASGNIAP